MHGRCPHLPNKNTPAESIKPRPWPALPMKGSKLPIRSSSFSVQIYQLAEVFCELAGDVAGGEAVTLATLLNHRYTDNQLQRA